MTKLQLGEANSADARELCLKENLGVVGAKPLLLSSTRERSAPAINTPKKVLYSSLLSEAEAGQC